MLIVKGLIGGLFQIGSFAALLLIPAGTWQWPRAIQFLTIYAVLLLGSILALARFAPTSLEARLMAPAAKTQPMADRVVTTFLVLALCAWLVFIPVDVFRLQLLPAPSLGVSLLGAALLLAGFAVMLATLFQNAFAAPIVADQAERGQVVIDTGLYSHIRHPFYLGFLVFLAGLALWLESYGSVLTMVVILIALVARIAVEERTLRTTLAGYDDYTNKVRYRLVPYVW